jgi:hypothetical protein
MNRQELETELGLKLPNNFEMHSEEEQILLIEYFRQLTPIQKHAQRIGYDHLKTSYDPFRSNGFADWKKKLSK